MRYGSFHLERIVFLKAARRFFWQSIEARRSTSQTDPTGGSLQNIDAGLGKQRSGRRSNAEPAVQ